MINVFPFNLFQKKKTLKWKAFLIKLLKIALESCYYLLREKWKSLKEFSKDVFKTWSNGL